MTVTTRNSVPPPINEASGKVLVIDDDSQLLDEARASLQRAGHMVQTCQNPLASSQALSFAEIVLVDYHMPGVDGVATVEWLRKVAVLKHCDPSFYLHTSDGQAAPRFSELGFDGVILKFNAAQALQDQVARALRLHRQRRM